MNTSLNQRARRGNGTENGIVGKSPAILAILEQLKSIALSDNTVLLIGETGVGKERFAEYVHQKSVRRYKPLVKISVSTLPRELVESELFGHERGAFTSASAEKKGLFEIANGGSLLLDDIDDLPFEIQPKLLRALESREIHRIGGTRSIPIDVRFVASSKVNLKELVDQGRYRSDLFYRLSVVPVAIPPLRDRREDIPLLLDHYLRQFLPDKEIEITRDALRALINYSWPGNVRELVNLVLRLLVFVNDKIDVEDLPLEIQGEEPIDMLLTSCTKCFIEEKGSFEEIIGCLEAKLLRHALAIHAGNKSRAARFLGMKLTTFRDKISRHHLTDFR